MGPSSHGDYSNLIQNLLLQDNENKFDMLVRNCVAHNGKKNPVQLVDEIGCITRPKIMSRFQKIKNFGPSATVVSYAYFQAFKFPDSMNVHFQCVIQVCRFSCPEPQCGSGSIGGAAGPPTIGGPDPRIPSGNAPNSYTVNNDGPPLPASFVRTPTGPPSNSFSSGGAPSSYSVNSFAGSSGSFRANAPPPPPPSPSNIQV